MKREPLAFWAIADLKAQALTDFVRLWQAE